MSKSPALLKSTRIRIGKFKNDNPDVSFEDLANKFNCTYSQARSAVVAFNKGELKSVRKRAVSAKKVQEIADSTLPDDSLKEEYEYTLNAIRADKKIEPAQRVVLLDKLISMRKTLQVLSLANHLKRADAELISMIIRRFEPTATDERVIQIYNEELAKLRGSR